MTCVCPLVIGACLLGNTQEGAPEGSPRAAFPGKLARPHRPVHNLLLLYTTTALTYLIAGYCTLHKAQNLYLYFTIAYVKKPALYERGMRTIAGSSREDVVLEGLCKQCLCKTEAGDGGCCAAALAALEDLAVSSLVQCLLLALTGLLGCLVEADHKSSRPTALLKLPLAPSDSLLCMSPPNGCGRSSRLCLQARHRPCPIEDWVAG